MIAKPQMQESKEPKEPPKRPKNRVFYEDDSEAYLKYTKYACSICGSSLKKIFTGFFGLFFDGRRDKCINKDCENYYDK